MLTDKFFKLWNYVFIFGTSIRAIPWRWDSHQHRLVDLLPFTQSYPNLNKHLTQFHLGLQIFLRMAFTTNFMLAISIFDVPSFQTMIAFCFVGLWPLTATMALILLLPSFQKKIKLIGNALFLFNEHHMTFYGENISAQVEEKGNFLFKLILALTVMGLGSTVFFLPSTLFFLSLDWDIFWVLSYPYFPGSKVIIATIFAYVYTMDAFFSVFMLVAVFMFAITISGWLEENVCRNSVTSPEVKYRYQVLYRAHQILHRHLEEMIYYLIPLFAGVAVVCTIIMLYAVIDMQSILSGFILGCLVLIAVAALFCLKILISKCCEWTTNSMAYPASFQKLDTNYSHLDERFFKSFKAIVWKIGPWFEIDESLFPAILNFVIEWIINLLLESDLHS